MTDRELMQQALEALDYEAERGNDDGYRQLRDALRERLAQPNIFSEIVKDKTQRTHWEGCEEVHPECRQQEPVAWVTGWHDGHCVIRAADPALMLPIGAALYTAPQRREWVGLTADEIWKCNAAPKGSAVEYHICMAHQNVLDFAEAIEAKLKEKNT